MLKVLVNAYAVAPNWGSEQGMGWNWISNLSEYCELYVITEGEWRKEIEEALKTHPHRDRIHFNYLPVPDRVRRMCWNQGDYRFYLYYKAWQRRAYRKARELMSEVHIDIVHQLNMVGFREPGFLWKIKTVPYIWGPIAGMELMPVNFLKGQQLSKIMKVVLKNSVNRVQRRFHPRFRMALKRADAVVAATKGCYDYLKESRPDVILINETACFINDVASSAVFDKSKFNVLWVGRFEFSKQLELALRTFARLRDYPEIILHVVGTGTPAQVNRYREIVRQYGLESSVVFHGKIPNDNVRAMMREADLFFFTSIMEATSTVVPEAISAGLPVLCFDRCGFGPLVDETIGIKHPCTTSETAVHDFAESIISLYKDRERLAAMSRACLERRYGISWESSARKMVEIYQQSFLKKRKDSAKVS